MDRGNPFLVSHEKKVHVDKPVSKTETSCHSNWDGAPREKDQKTWSKQSLISSNWGWEQDRTAVSNQEGGDTKFKG